MPNGKTPIRPLREKCYLYAIVFSVVALISFIFDEIYGDGIHIATLFLFSIAVLIWVNYIVGIGVRCVCKKKGKKYIGIVDDVIRVFDWLSFSAANTNRQYIIKYNNKKIKTCIFTKKCNGPKLFDRCIVYIWGPLKYTEFEEV